MSNQKQKNVKGNMDLGYTYISHVEEDISKERFIMKKEKNLLDKIAEAINTEECCMECLLEEISKLIYTDNSYDEKIKNELLAIINDDELCDRCKLQCILSLINEYIER